MTNAEPLLFVDNDQSQVLEAHVFVKEPVGTDDDIHDAGGKVGQHRLDLFGSLKPGERPHLNGKRRKAARERFGMLLRQQGGGHQHRHLPVILDGLKRRAHRHFGFTVPDVPAHEPVHGFGQPEVPLNVVDRFDLVRGFFIIERRIEFMGQGAVLLVWLATDDFPVGIQLDEFVGHVLNGFLDARLGLGPRGASQFVEGRSHVLAAPKFLDLVQPVQRHIERVPSCKFQDEIVAFKTLHGESPKPLVPADAMLDVDHVVAGVQILQRGEKGRGFAFGLGAMP